MNQRNQLKIIAAALCAGVSFQVAAGLGSLQVQSGLGEPFSGSIVVTGEEAKILLSQGAPTINGAPLRASVVRQGSNAVIRLRSSQAIYDPLLSFGLSVGSQGRQYTALLDPPNYRVHAGKQPATVSPSTEAAARASARASVQASVAGQVQANRRVEAEASRSRPGKAREAVRGHAAASVFAGQRYTVQAHETLMDVARKVQPQGLTLAQTMRALVQANPRAFRHGNPDLMYRGATLNIPTAEQMRRLAKQAPVKAAKPATTQAPATVPVVTAPAEATVVAAPTPAASAEMPPAAMPAQTPSVAPSSEAVLAPAADGGAVVQVHEASVPTEPVVAEPASVTAPPPAAETEPVATETEGGLLSGLPGGWQPYALGGLGLLLLLALLLRRRRPKIGAVAPMDEAPVLIPGSGVAAEPVVADDDDGVVFETDLPAERVSTTAPLAAAVTAAAAPVVAAAVVAEDAEDAEDEKQVQQDDDWAWLTQAENEAAAAPAPATAPGSHVVETDWLDEQAFAEPTKVAQTDDAVFGDDDWLQLESADEVSTPVAAAAVEQPVAEVSAGDDDFEWLVEADVPSAAAVAVSPEEAAQVDDDFAWPEEDMHTEAETVPVAVVPVAAESVAATDDLTWNINSESDTQVESSSESKAASWASTGVEDDAWTWDEDGATVHAPAEAASPKATDPAADAQQRHAFAASDQDLAVVDVDWDALGLVEDSGGEAEAPAAELPLTDVSAADVAPVELEAPMVEPLLDAPSFDEPEEASAMEAPAAEAFVDATPVASAAVNLSVPLEAKLELAKMYLEIDDAQTARKTLQELVNEAEGEILEEARVLLQQLGH